MALTEYTPGSAFPGRMGRTIGESQPAWPAPRRAREGAPNVLFIVIDDTGFGQLGCYGGDINTPNLDKLAKNGLLLQQHAHHRALLALALVHPHRPQPPLQRHVLHHRGLDRLSRRQRRHSRSRTASCPRSSCSRATRPTASASGTSRPPSRSARPVPTTAGRSAAASSATTASSAATRTSTTRTSSTTITRSSRRRRPEQGYHLTEDLVDQVDHLHRRSQAGGARQALLPLLRPRRQPRAPPRAEGVGRQVQGQVRRRLGRLSRAGPRASRSSSASCRRTRCCPGTIRTCRTGRSSRPTSASSTPA